MPKFQISLKDWSDYRGKQTGLVMFMEPCLQAVLPEHIPSRILYLFCYTNRNKPREAYRIPLFLPKHPD